MVTHSTKPSLSPALERTLAWHAQEAKRLRQAYGDPSEALTAFVLEHYDQEALAEAFDDLINRGNPWDDWDDDVIDER